MNNTLEVCLLFILQNFWPVFVSISNILPGIFPRFEPVQGSYLWDRPGKVQLLGWIQIYNCICFDIRAKIKILNAFGLLEVQRDSLPGTSFSQRTIDYNLNKFVRLKETKLETKTNKVHCKLKYIFK